MIKCHSRERSYAAGIKWIAYSGFLFHSTQTPPIKRVSSVSWKHVNFYGEYDFRETPDGIDLAKIVDWVEAFNGNPK